MSGGALRSKTSWLLWALASGVYLLAIFHRTSLGVAGPWATERLSLTALALSSFVMVQLIVYMLMQVPTGILVDRFGPWRVLLAATLIQGIAQLVMAVAMTYWIAILSRTLLGIGDALTLIAVLRVVAVEFSPRRSAVPTAMVGLVACVGNLLSTLPLTAMLQTLHWGLTFALAGAASLIYSVPLLKQAASRPSGGQASTATMVRSPLLQVRLAWRSPFTRLGFWVHLTVFAGPTMFGVLWGFPYLVEGVGLGPTAASWLLLMLVLISAIVNLVVGPMFARRPGTRMPVALCVALLNVLGWSVLGLWPAERPPVAVLIVVITAFALGGLRRPLASSWSATTFRAPRCQRQPGS